MSFVLYVPFDQKACNLLVGSWLKLVDVSFGVDLLQRFSVDLAVECHLGPRL